MQVNQYVHWHSALIFITPYVSKHHYSSNLGRIEHGQGKYHPRTRYHKYFHDKKNVKTIMLSLAKVQSLFLKTFYQYQANVLFDIMFSYL